ncbi:hypothetical protein CAPN001_09920 [Capnocytophaga stomatis]|uniref:type II site-specific deoxyribonuclease n=1 Tax=Capnocytophaga stomatis TaxID=1848904 RepID=A0A250FTU1_9FLAO|nr:restriction endonuclease [Capnocytophaga stomatis]ATA88572.1 restriction endonuclease [Capnocytophaga stomatis]GIJ96423.1 hypothetical protein CAPN001_09920 [Capnocytophaga stomatis]
MILEYEYFKNLLNQKLFEDSYSDLLRKIAENPDRYIGIFRPTKPKTKLIQNITQSHEIRFGDALEYLFEKYFQTVGFTLLPKRFRNSQDKEYNIDQLFSDGNTIFMIEQKVRDDHDSTKKVGQFNNFESKYFELTQLYPTHKIVPIMWFIDDSLRKNRKYYLSELEKMANDYDCENYLFYGEEIFGEKGGITTFDFSIWQEVLQYLEIWKNTLPDMPEINFDHKANEVFEEIKNLPPIVFRKIFGNEEVVQQIFPIIFPTGETLNLLQNYFQSKADKIYNTLAMTLQDVLALGNQ